MNPPFLTAVSGCILIVARQLIFLRHRRIHLLRSTHCSARLCVGWQQRILLSIASLLSADVLRVSLVVVMVKHITVRWNDEASNSHAYAQVIPHLTLHPPHLYAASRRTGQDNVAPSADIRGKSIRTTTDKGVALAEEIDAAHVTEVKLPSPDSPTSSPPHFPSSPNKARLLATQSNIDAINSQLAQLRAEAEDEVADRQSGRRQQRAVSSTLTRRDVLQFRHAGCTGNGRVNDAVNRLMGPEHTQLTQLYQPKHSRPPPIPSEQHEQAGTVDSRNAAVNTAPFVFFSSQPRFGKEEEVKEQSGQGGLDKENSADREELPSAKEAREQERKSAGQQERRKSNAGEKRNSRQNHSLAAPLRAASAKRAVTDKAAVHSSLESRTQHSSATEKTSRLSMDSGEVSGRKIIKQSSPPPQPNPPPPAPTPKTTESRMPEQPIDRSITQLPARPGWLSWRVGPGTNNNQPAAHVTGDNQTLLTIGKAEWREVEVGGEQRGKARVRQRRLEEEWQWNERIEREKRSRDMMKRQAGLAVDHGRVEEYDAAIAREKALEQRARQQIIREEQRLETMRSLSKQQAADAKYEMEVDHHLSPAFEAWTAHPFIHPTFPPPPPPAVLHSRTHPALSHPVSQPQLSHFTAAPTTATAAPQSPPTTARLQRQPANETAQSTKSSTTRIVQTLSQPVKRAASQKTARRTARPRESAAKRPTRGEEAVKPRELYSPPLAPLPSQQPQHRHINEPSTLDMFAAIRPPQPSVPPFVSTAPLDEVEVRLHRHIQRYAQQLRDDNAMVDRDERYVRSMGSKDVRRQRMINNIARARRDIRQKEAHITKLRRQLMETRARREAAGGMAATTATHNSTPARYQTAPSLNHPRYAASASKAVQVPDVFVAVRDAKDSQSDNERWRLQRSIESDMAAIVEMLQSKVHSTHQQPSQHTERQQQRSNKGRVEVEDVTSEQLTTDETHAYNDDSSHHHEHEHHYVDSMSLSASSSSSLPTTTDRGLDDSEMRHARALRIIQGRAG